VSIGADVCAATVSLALGLLILSFVSSAEANSLGRFSSNLWTDAVFPLALVMTLAIAGFYRTTNRSLVSGMSSELKDLSLSVAAACVLAVVLGALRHALFQVSEPSSVQIGVACLVSVVVVAIGHSVTRRVVASLRPTRVLVVGSQSQADRLALTLGHRRGTEMVGRVNDNPDFGEGALGQMADLRHLCTEHGVNQVIVSFPAAQTEETVAILRSLPSYVHVAVIPRLYELVSWRSRLADLSGIPLIEVAPAHLSTWDKAIKRTFDIVVALFVLFLFSPVLVAVAIAVKLTSKGPVLFRQTRVGRNQQRFTIFKFRTMQVCDEGAAGSSPVHPSSRSADGVALHVVRNKASEARRHTRVGGVLRRTGFDELPQLFNVLTGAMSVVGPRPFVPEETSDHFGEASRRFEVRPGITGLWQVSGRNDLNEADLSRLDSLYVESWSVMWDLKIIWDTPLVMVRGVGAY
jgi:exopolysaccharide biosynthesis polyprenyl glycosylphosphotransferase